MFFYLLFSVYYSFGMYYASDPELYNTSQAQANTNQRAPGPSNRSFIARIRPGLQYIVFYSANTAAQNHDIEAQQNSRCPQFLSCSTAEATIKAACISGCAVIIGALISGIITLATLED